MTRILKENKMVNINSNMEQETVAAHYCALQKYCLKITGSTWDGEDLAQSVWMKFFDKKQNLKHSNIEALLLRMAKNMWLDQVRREKTLRMLMKRVHIDQIASLKQGIEEVDRQEETTAVFRFLMSHLSNLQCQVMTLRNFLDLSVRETADLLATSEGAVKAADYRARTKLAALYSNRTGECFSGKYTVNEIEAAAVAAAYLSGDVRLLAILLANSESEEGSTLQLHGFSKQAFSDYAGQLNHTSIPQMFNNYSYSNVSIRMAS